MEPRRRRKWLRRGLAAGVVTLAVLLAVELFARYYLGLGDPPLSMADPAIEYLFKPGQDCRRFGNVIRYNAYSMRSPDFPNAKADPREFRVLVLGDSVVNGGAQTDQTELATTILQQRLHEHMGRPVVVGNVSAGSWGPSNLLAYARRFGFFQADVVVVVLSSHDAHDVPTFAPSVGVHPNMPGERPPFAAWEGVERYLMPKLRGREGGADTPDEPSAADVAKSTAALQELIGLAAERGAKVVVALHRERDEVGRPEPAAFQTFRDASAHAQAVDLDAGLSTDDTISMYRDHVHPSAAGQRHIADRLLPLVRGE